MTERVTHATHDSDKRYLPAMGHDRLLPLYDVVTRLLRVGALHRELVDQAGIGAGDRVLEIGCGTGNLALLVKRIHPGADVVGLDPDGKALARARRKAGRRGLSLQFDRGFAGTLTYPDETFDRVLSTLMFHHLGPEEKAAALREVRRVLKPGAALHLADFGGTAEPANGFVARRVHRGPRLRDNVGERIPTLLAEAGLADPGEIARRATVLGPVVFYRATKGGAPAGR